MKCPSCGEGNLVRDRRDLPSTYKGETAMIPAVRGEFSPACEESVLGAAEAKQVCDRLPLPFRRDNDTRIEDSSQEGGFHGWLLS